ncbi:MarR family winged helix-turn-helix transcriptional regulator [Microlunatus sp. Gsoil 973]|uniref:MarR family winged helix-turn-helix transcriptional regulator n=1 Tax=Microlunatus sp. Gsoil 973 TaxID=2672569 RepID=UPI0012B474B5|nr:MarR family transcriptional regulator [Microlunatus sp. Gsoil 973]QGN33810.1 MarR family transcriptional regulator [Microlunatus sp. Gsoil 973]
MPSSPLEDQFADVMAVLPRISRLGSSLNRGELVERALRASGVSLDRPSMTVLMSLRMADGPLRIGEIARRMEVAGPHVTRLVHELERRGLAKRVADPDDRRARLVELTPAGADAATGYMHGIFGWFGEALADWSADDLRTLGALLSRLIDDLSAHAARTDDRTG